MSDFSIGLSLESIGINNYALTREQALNFISDFKIKQIAVLGGDVVEIENGKPKLTRENWYCDKNDSEDDQKFAMRSAEYAKDWISKYSSNGAMFALTVKELNVPR